MYFSKFPNLVYDMKGDGNVKLVTNILRRIKVRDKVRDNLSLFDNYDLDIGDTPESVSYKVYGSVDYYWVILLMNNIKDRYYDWPLNLQDFETYVKEKYSNPAGIHHYEIDQSSGTTDPNGPGDFDYKIEVNSDTVGAQSVSNYEYEQRLQDQKRQIKILNQNYLPTFVREFERLIKK
jgi:hypothetical protein